MRNEAQRTDVSCGRMERCGKVLGSDRIGLDWIGMETERRELRHNNKRGGRPGEQAGRCVRGGKCRTHKKVGTPPCDDELGSRRGWCI